MTNLQNSSNNKQNGKGVDPKLTFAMGWLMGRRSRRRDGIGCGLLVLGVLAGLMAAMTAISAPLAWSDARQVRRLHQPSAAELTALAPGREILLTVTLASEQPALDTEYALFYQEQSVRVPDAESGTRTEKVKSPPIPARVDVLLVDGTPIQLQVASGTTFLNAQSVSRGNLPLALDDDADLAAEGAPPIGTVVAGSSRVVGYLPGQTLTVRGTWEGRDLLTAETLYAGALDDYLSYVARSPGVQLLMGLGCGGIALMLLLLGGILRFVGV
ncbi:MAG: hypothetical protein KDD78_18185 [Caldilineaceae bacterium]|nr:hypothetical protein [Caldilineaceae bacterium]